MNEQQKTQYLAWLVALRGAIVEAIVSFEGGDYEGCLERINRADVEIHALMIELHGIVHPADDFPSASWPTNVEVKKTPRPEMRTPITAIKFFFDDGSKRCPSISSKYRLQCWARYGHSGSHVRDGYEWKEGEES